MKSTFSTLELETIMHCLRTAIETYEECRDRAGDKRCGPNIRLRDEFQRYIGRATKLLIELE